MTGPTKGDRRDLVLVPVVVLTVMGLLLSLGYLIAVLLRIPPVLGLSLPVRLLGAVLLGVAFGLFAWLFQYRRPVDVLASTYLTLIRAFRGVELKVPRRSEPLVIRGPYKWVRHPIYLAVLFSLVGWGLLLGFTFVLFAAPLALLWFNFVVMPFEERELLVLFGREYEEYLKRVRRLLPIPRRS